MKFYISWSHSDALFSDYFPGCPTLVSATPDNLRPFRNYRSHPRDVIIDSGALYYQRQARHESLSKIFHRQLDTLQDLAKETIVKLVQVDHIMFNKNTLSERYATMEKNLLNAYEYMNVYIKANLQENAMPLGVIQGYDIPSIIYSAKQLMSMGYQYFGIGSLLARTPKDQIEFIDQASRIVGSDRLHVFGVTGMRQLKAMSRLNVASIDSSRPTMAAAYYQVFYSNPFRTYVIENSRVSERKAQRLKEPLPCDCPVCKEHAHELFLPSPRYYMRLRSVHNYFHLLKTINQIIQEQEVSSNALSNVLRP